jgi:hypothetical protein
MAMSDDWRVRIDLHEDGHARSLTDRLEATDLEHELESEFHDRVVVSRDGPEVFLYAGSREQAEAAEKLVRSLAHENGWHLETELKRWHEASEAWKDPDAPVPQDDADRAAEHAQLIASEREQVRRTGTPEFEVRVECPSHADAELVVAKLREDGRPSVQRSNYVLTGAFDEDDAAALAARLQDEVPPGCTVTVEGSAQAVYDERPSSPFAFLGGLAG